MARREQKDKDQTAQERYFVATQWQLMWRKFRKHKAALFGGGMLMVFYLAALFCEFLSPYDPVARRADYPYAPPQRIRFVDSERRFHLRPFVYGFTRSIDRETLKRVYVIDVEKVYPVRLFIQGEPYRFFGLIPARMHLFGVKEGTIYLFGTEKLGRDMFSRVLYAARISLSIGLVGVGISFVLGITLGGISGYFGGSVDMVVQRAIELLFSIPRIPLWMSLAAALPRNWSPLQVYFAITIILSIVGWGGLARVVRGKLLELREEDFTIAARISGASNGSIIARHMLPSFTSYLIVHLTLAVPSMLLAETALSFLGLGLRPPVVSWGTLLQGAQNVRTVALYPWLLIPAIFVIVTVLTFNFLGDGLRDAADPYK